jgi:hypothetical protein
VARSWRILFPELVIPFSVFLAGHLSVLSSGIEALMSQVLLEKPQAIPGIIDFYRIHREGIPELVGTNVVYLTCFVV